MLNLYVHRQKPEIRIEPATPTVLCSLHFHSKNRIMGSQGQEFLKLPFLFAQGEVVSFRKKILFKLSYIL